MKVVKKIIARITVDELGEPNILIKFIGVTFILFGLLFIFDLISINSQFLMCIAFAGASFVFSDISQYYYESYARRVNLTDKQSYRAKSICKTSKFVALFFAIFSLLAGPYILLPFTNSSIEKMATIITVIAIGFTIYNVSLNNTKKRLDFYERLTTDFEQLHNEYEKIKEVHEKSTLNTNELYKTLNEFTSSYNESVKDFKQTTDDYQLLMRGYKKLSAEHETLKEMYNKLSI